MYRVHCTPASGYIFRVLDHLTQNIICPEFFNHELIPAKKFAESQAREALSDPATLLVEEAHRVSI